MKELNPFEEEPTAVQRYHGQPRHTLLPDEPVKWRRFLRTTVRYLISKLQLGIEAGEARLQQEIEKVRNLQADTAIKEADADLKHTEVRLRQLDVIERARNIERTRMEARRPEPEVAEPTRAELEALLGKIHELSLRFGTRIEFTVVNDVPPPAQEAAAAPRGEDQDSLPLSPGDV